MGLEIRNLLVAQGPCIQCVGFLTGPYIDDGELLEMQDWVCRVERSPCK